MSLGDCVVHDACTVCEEERNEACEGSVCESADQSSEKRGLRVVCLSVFVCVDGCVAGVDSEVRVLGLECEGGENRSCFCECSRDGSCEVGQTFIT